MASGINASGTDLDNLFALYISGTKANNTGINAAGVDIATRYQALASGNGTQRANVGIQSASVDLAALFSQYGSTTTPTPTPTPSPTPTPTPVGGGGTCIALEMFLHTTLQGSNINEGDWVDGVSFYPNPYIFTQQVTRVSVYEAECLRLESESGAVLIASETTPMPIRGQISKLLPEINPEMDEIMVNLNGKLGWEKIKSLEAVGKRSVALLEMPLQCYFSGEDTNHRIASHMPHSFYTLPDSGETLHANATPVLKP